MIEIMRDEDLPRARAAGALVGAILEAMRERTVVGTNLLEIDEWTKEMMLGAGGESCYVDYAPSFGRGPFGHYICTAVNDAVLHGLPHDRTLADGDLLTLDLAVSKGGVAADSAISFIVGESRPAESVALIDATQRALSAGIAVAAPGARLGDISHAIGAVLTEAGEVLLRRSRQLVKSAGQLEELAHHMEQGWEPEVRLVVDAAYPTVRLVRALSAFMPDRKSVV